MIFGAIYSLSETPESNSFYIGRTGSESLVTPFDLLWRRRGQHIDKALDYENHTTTTRCQHKIIHLHCMGKKPSISLVEYLPDTAKEEMEDQERYWIRLFLDYGHKLLNEQLVNERHVPVNRRRAREKAMADLEERRVRNVEISALRAEETKLRAIPRSPVSIFDPPNPEEQRLWEIRDRLTALRQDAASP